MEVRAEQIGECAGFGEARLEGEVLSEAGGPVEGVAEVAGHVDAVAGVCAGTENGAAGLVRAADDGDGEGERVGGVREGGDVAADQGAVPMLGPALEGRGEFVGAGLVEVLRERAGSECADRRAGHGGDVGDGAGDCLAGDQVEGCALGKVAIFDDLIDGEEAIGIADADDGAVIAGSGEDAREPSSESRGACGDGGEEIGFAQRKRVARRAEIQEEHRPEGRCHDQPEKRAVKRRRPPESRSVTGKATSQPRAVALSVRAKR